MAADSPLDQLAQKVDGLTLANVTAEFPATHADVNPLDFWRAHLTKVLNGITGVAPEIIFPAINWTTTLDKGDFMVAVPAFRIKGSKPDALSKEWCEKVGCRSTDLLKLCGSLTWPGFSSPATTLSSRSRHRTDLS